MVTGRGMGETADAVSALSLANGFADRIADCADAADRRRALPASLVASLKAAGVFRQLLPARFGGLGVTLPDFVRALQVYGSADASTAWCVAQNAVIGITSLWLPEASARTLWSDPDCAVANGPPRDCVAVPTDESGGGYRVSGRWGFSSGCHHATWMHGALRRSTDRVWFGVYFPKREAALHDNWQVAGLRGSGSLEFSVNDLLVAPEWVTDFRSSPIDAGTLYRIPVTLVFAVSFGSVALGVARAALDTVLELAQGKVPGYSSSALRDDPDMQALTGRVEMRWRAARAFLHDTVGQVWEAVNGQETILPGQRIELRMAGTHAINEAVAVMDGVYQVAGSSAIYQTSPLQRRFQDLKVIGQHVQGRPMHYGVVGRYFLGHPFQPGPMI